jgi:integrase
VCSDSQALGLDRLQLGTLVAMARGSSPMEAALITLLGLLGLRVSEACSVDLEDFGSERRHRTCTSSAKAANPPSCRCPRGRAASPKCHRAVGVDLRKMVGAHRRAIWAAPIRADPATCARRREELRDW